MNYYSQKNPEYAFKKLPKSSLTLKNYGCYVCSIATLAQVHPATLLNPADFAEGGLLYSGRVANRAGIKYVGRSKNPSKGWCIGVTDHYAPKWPTHFFLVNEEKGLQIDPLDTNPKPEPLTYNCFQYRIFEGVKIDETWEEKIKKDMLAAGITSDLDQRIGDWPAYQIGEMIRKMVEFYK